MDTQKKHILQNEHLQNTAAGYKMKVTWEVMVETPEGWASLHECSGTDFKMCYLNALHLMKQWKEIRPDLEWELKNEKTIQ